MLSKHLELEPKVCWQQEQRLAYLADIGEKIVEIAHEARSPLTTILLGLNHCQKLNLSEADKKRIALAQEEAERLKHLLDNLLSESKSPPPTGALLQTRSLELNLLIKDTLTLIDQFPRMQSKKINFVSYVPTVWIKGDRNKLKQIFINLIINACEAIEPGEEILWEIVPLASKDRVDIQIHNGGQPISPQLMPNLVTPWVTTKPEGTGLGLVIAKQLVEAHGGELTINSSNNRGTTVKINLPLLKLENIFAS
ncbi:MAG TPA: PAS domain-containing sensor histidine kinase [Xenococcaceae cyanobacterium]|jgi:signal transduction histidine kinase